MVDFGKLSHDIDLSLMFWYFLEHLFFHKLDCDDPVLTEMVSLVDDSVVALSQLFGLIDVEVIGDFIHALHLLLI
jgi:hypothetical protein